MIRINKFVASCGEVSRRKADELIMAGRVQLNGEVAGIGDQVDPQTDRVTLDGKELGSQEHIYLAMYKPENVLTTMHDPQGRRCVRDLIPKQYLGVVPSGRLDYDASGLLLLTNDGDLSNYIHHPSHSMPKTYIIRVTPQADPAQIQQMEQGVMLDGRQTRPAKVKLLRHQGNSSTLKVTLKQGLKNQLKRMGTAVGLKVTAIKRISIGPINLDDMQPGETRLLKNSELKSIYKMINPQKKP